MKLLFVTTNPSKIAEAKEIGTRYGITFVQNCCDVKEIRSQDPVEVALESAKEAYTAIKKPLIVEDSGVFIETLKGFPGTYSAYALKTIGLDGILKLMSGVENRAACMKSAVAYMDGKETRAFLGVVKGRISDNARGDTGFGYDPVFIPEGASKTFGEDSIYKMKVSHRAQSLKQFCEWYSKKVVSRNSVMGFP